MRVAAAAVVAVMLPLAAHAGRTCEEHKPTTASVTRGLALAQKTSDALDRTGADVVVLARAGQDLTNYRLKYSHLGFAYRAPQAGGGTAWRVVHKLNHCGTASADVYRQGLGEFFLDEPWRYVAAWVVPTREVQAKLLPLLQDNAQVAQLHRRPYSMVSYAWSERYQQSNQWALETLAGAMAPEVGNSRAKAQSWLAFKGYQPSVLAIGPLTRLGGRMTKANVAFDDHPPEKRFADRIETVTVDSVFEWLARSGYGGGVATTGQP
jgi:hypothetical protein